MPWSEPVDGETASFSDDPEPMEQPEQLLPFPGVDQPLDQMTDVHVRMTIVDATPIGDEIDTAVPVGLAVSDTVRLTILDTIDRAIDDRHGVDRSDVHRAIERSVDVDRHLVVCTPIVPRHLRGQPRQSAEHHHQCCEHRRSPHVHPFRCVPYRRDDAARFDAVVGFLRRLASNTMRRAIVMLAVAVIGFGTYGAVVDSPFVSYYIPITIVLAMVVAWIHRTARFADSTLMALALAT